MMCGWRALARLPPAMLFAGGKDPDDRGAKVSRERKLLLGEFERIRRRTERFGTAAPRAVGWGQKVESANRPGTTLVD